jgi:hypothetical protein
VNAEHWNPGTEAGEVLINDLRDVNRRTHPRFPLMVSAWVWRKKFPEAPLVVRVMDHSEGGIGFTCAIAIEAGELIELSFDRMGHTRSGLLVSHCESFNEDTYRVGAIRQQRS